MSFGVTNEGFVIKRLSDILDSIEQKQKSDFGNVDVSASAVLGQLNGTFSNQLEEVWEQLQKAYDGSSPNLASGITLDFNVALNAISRLPALPTVVEVGMKGTDFTVIPANTQIRSTADNEIFQLRSDTELSPNLQEAVFMEVVILAGSTLYTVTINTTDVYTYTSSGSPTLDEIAQGIVDDINNDSGAVVTAEKFLNGFFKITGKAAAFDITYDSNFEYFTIGTFESVNLGEILAVSNTLTIIETPVSGLDEVNNFEDGVKGRGIETDPELRLRRLQSLQVIGAATLPAMIARMLEEVEGVVTVNGYDNREDVPDIDGRPPHSVELVVQGGDDQDIFDKLWEIKGGGIKTHGNTPGTIVDGNGTVQNLAFSRPVNKYAHMICDLTLYSEEEFPTDGASQVKTQILEYGESLGIGKDIIPQRFHGSIYEVPGIGNIAIQIAVTNAPLDTPVYTTSTIPIDADEISVWDTGRIVVNVV